MARSGAESTKELVLAALLARLKSIDPIVDPDYFFLPNHVIRVEMPELQYLDNLVFPNEGMMVYFVADEEGLDDEEATEDEMTEEMEVWVSVFRRVPGDKQTENPYGNNYFVKSLERTRIWSDFFRAMSVPDAELGLGFVENVNITDNRPLWADVPESLEKWVGILFRVAITYQFSRAEPWTT